VEVREAYERRRSVETPLGELAYVTAGEGEPALFVHGIFVSSYLWRHVIAALSDNYRCLAVDLPGHGRSPGRPDQDLSFAGLADLLDAFCDELSLAPVHLVGNDTGGGICQVFAGRHPARVRTLTLTNCETEGKVPPPGAEKLFEAARAGQLQTLAHRMSTDHDFARSEHGLGTGFERPARVEERDLEAYLEPFAAPTGAATLERLVVSLDDGDIRAVRGELATLEAPTLIVWGTGDVFFDKTTANELFQRIGGARELVELDGAKLFFPDERADELVPLLRRHWRSA
jgi:pimeloyl-ACP methyl ester carboxylesterase